MPRIPVYTADQGLNPGGTPNLQVDTSAQTAGAAEFGALSNLGAKVGALAEHLQKRQQQTEDLNATIAFDGFRRTQQARLLNESANMPAGGAGFSDGFIQPYDTDASKFIQTLPPRLQKQYHGHIENEKITLANQAGLLELKASREHARTQIDGLNSRQLNDINANPAAAEDYYQYGVQAIDQSRLLPDEKIKLKQDWRTAARSTELLARYGTDPDGLAHAVGLPTASARTEARENAAVDYFVKKGLSPVAAAAFVGRLSHESGGMNTTALNPGDGQDGSDSIGLGQWNSARAKALKTFASSRNSAPDDFQTQLDFAWSELSTTERKSLDMLQTAKTPEDAARGALEYERPRGWSENGAYAPENVAGYSDQVLRTHRIIQRQADGGSGAKFAGDPRFVDLDLATKQNLYAKAKSQAAAVNGQLKYDLTKQVDDDVASVEATGTGRDISPERVATTLGPVKYAEWQDRRTAARNTWLVTNDMPSMPDADLQARVVSLQPKAGDADFAQKQQVYDSAQKRASDLMKLRRTDPAQAVLEIPEVRDAHRAIDARDPVTVQRAVTASLAAQTAAGIPEGVQSPITRDDAKRIAAPLVAVSRVTPEGIVTRDERKVLEGVVRTVQSTYGPYAERVLPHVIEEGIKDRQFGPIATTIFKKLVRGEAIMPSDRTAVERSSDVANATQAITATSTASKSMPAPSYGAIQLLISKPELAPQFDQKYGSGAAGRLLQERQ